MDTTRDITYNARTNEGKMLIFYPYKFRGRFFFMSFISHNKHTFVHWLSQLLEVHTRPVPSLLTHTYIKVYWLSPQTPSCGKIVETKRAWVCYSVWPVYHLHPLHFPLPWTRRSPPPPSMWENWISLNFNSLSFITPTPPTFLPPDLSLYRETLSVSNKHRDQDLWSLFLYGYTRDLVFWMGRQFNGL
jgi:hypothetical protein